MKGDNLLWEMEMIPLPSDREVADRASSLTGVDDFIERIAVLVDLLGYDLAVVDLRADIMLKTCTRFNVGIFFMAFF